MVSLRRRNRAMVDSGRANDIAGISWIMSHRVSMAVVFTSDNIVSIQMIVTKARCM